MTAILLFTHDVSAAGAEIARLGGRVLHVLTPSVVVADLPEDVVLAESTPARPSDLDDASARLADAWQAPTAKVVPSDGLPWDTPGKEAP